MRALSWSINQLYLLLHHRRLQFLSKCFAIFLLLRSRAGLVLLFQNSSLILPRHSPSRSVLSLARRRNQNAAIALRKRRKVLLVTTLEEGEENLDGDSFEALLSQLEEGVKYDNALKRR